MAGTLKETLLALANQIKNETTSGANTATRVGQALYDIIDGAFPKASVKLLLSQSGTIAPTKNYEKTTFSDSFPTLSYYSVGLYKVDLTGYISNRDKCFFGITQNDNHDGDNAIRAWIDSGNVLWIRTWNMQTNSAANSILNKTTFWLEQHD